MKAMEKERSLRYATPSALADDIGRYLSNEPVLARPASTSYRVRKYIRRNRFAVISATTLFALLPDLRSRRRCSCEKLRESGIEKTELRTL